MTPADVLKLTENELNQLLGRPTVSWGDKLPLMKPSDDTIQAVIKAWQAKQPIVDAGPISDVCGIDYSSYSMDVKETCLPAAWVAEAVKAEQVSNSGDTIAAEAEFINKNVLSKTEIKSLSTEYYKRDAEIMAKRSNRYREALERIAELGTTQYPRALDMTKIAKDALVPTMTLEPVGQELDGSFKPVKEMSYKPYKPSFSELPYSKAAPILNKLTEQFLHLDCQMVGAPSVEPMADFDDDSMLRITLFSNKYQARFVVLASGAMLADEFVVFVVEEVKHALANPPEIYKIRPINNPTKADSEYHKDGYKLGFDDGVRAGKREVQAAMRQEADRVMKVANEMPYKATADELAIRSQAMSAFAMTGSVFWPTVGKDAKKA